VTIVTDKTNYFCQFYQMKPKSFAVKNPARWLHVILRLVFAAVFFAVGWIYRQEGGAPAAIFGLIFLITAFFAPRRCTGDNGSCSV